jgi:hypothetical protein
MPKTRKNNLFYKRECERSRKEKLCRDIACYGVTIFAAVMGFLLVDANVSLANAESDAASNSVVIAQHLN